MAEALKSQGFDRADRKYIGWYEEDDCGAGVGFADDDRAGADNANNSGPAWAMVGHCALTWHGTLHELLHTLGAVQLSAPHHTAHNHCWDDQDIMCYDDKGIPPGESLKEICGGGADTNQIDCNKDDYFNVRPRSGSYLATHWNVANNQFLISQRREDVAIRNKNSGQCLAIGSSSTANGGAALQWTCMGIADQQWTFYPSGDHYTIVNTNSGKCLAIGASSKDNGAKAIQWTCLGIADQQWYVIATLDGYGGFQLVNVNSGKCLAIGSSSTTKGARAIQWTCMKIADQTWN